MIHMIIEQLKHLNNLTHQEQAVVNTILMHPHELLRMSLRDLAIISYTSNATIVRLCKKLGYRGFPDFKFAYVSEYEHYLAQQEVAMDIPFTKESTTEDIISRLPLIYAKSLDTTRSSLDIKVIKRCFDIMHNCQHIGIYGTGTNFDLARMYQYRFEEVNIPAIAYDSDHWQHLSRLKIKKIPSFSILISLSGSNPMIIDIAERMHSLEIPSLLITGRQNPKLSALCTETILTIDVASTLNLYNMTSMIAAQYILDIFVSMAVVRNYDEIDEVVSEPTMNVEAVLNRTK